MVDIHCHIIPCVDDGSQSFEETMRMIEKAKKVGFNKIIATPHYIDRETKISSEFIKESVEKLNQELQKKHMDIELYSGNEVFFTNDMLELVIQKKILPIANSKYILIEFPMYNGRPLNIRYEIQNLMNAGYIPIIAHPERYNFVSNDIVYLEKLIQMGVLLQINAGSISGTYGKMAKKNVKTLLRRNMVHLIGTDSHNSKWIYDMYQKCLRKMRFIIGSRKLYMILGNGDKILKNEEVTKFKIKKRFLK